jgi:hypothetical protein
MVYMRNVLMGNTLEESTKVECLKLAVDLVKQYESTFPSTRPQTLDKLYASVDIILKVADKLASGVEAVDIRD